MTAEVTFIDEGSPKEQKTKKILKRLIDKTQEAIFEVANIMEPDIDTRLGSKEAITSLIYVSQNVLAQLYFNIFFKFLVLDEETAGKADIKQLLVYLVEDFSEKINSMTNDILK